MSTVADIIEKIEYRVDNAESELNDIVIPWIDSFVQYFSQILFRYKSDLVEAPFSLTFAIGDDHKALDSACWGLLEKPWIDGKISKLLPVEDYDQVLRYGTTQGVPERYRLIGQDLYVYPTPDTETIIKGSIYKKPITISSTTDAIPYFGLFDITIVDMVVEAYKVANPTVGRLDQIPRNATQYVNLVKLNAAVESIVLGRNANNPSGPRFNTNVF